MNFELQESLEILVRTPAVLSTLLRGLSPAWQDADEGPDTWNPRGILGHLIVGEETDWVPRARIILEHGDTRPFEPFDRFAQFERYGDWPLERLLARFDEARRESLETVRGWSLTGEQLSLRGRHPELGAVTLRQLIATWAVHDLDHVSQVVRVMAKRYTEDVGVWRAYLRIVAPEP